MFLKTQSISETKREFIFAKMELLYVPIVQARSGCVPDELIYFRVNFSPKVLGEHVAPRQRGGSV